MKKRVPPRFLLWPFLSLLVLLGHVVLGHSSYGALPSEGICSPGWGGHDLAPTPAHDRLVLGSQDAALDPFRFAAAHHESAYFQSPSQDALLARKALNDFLEKYRAFGFFGKGQVLTGAPFRHDALFFGLGSPFAPPDLSQTALAASSDTSVFKMVVQRVMQLMPGNVKHFYDLGSGESLSTLGGILSAPQLHEDIIYHGRDRLTVHAIDVDQVSLGRAQMRARQLNGLDGVCEFECRDMIALLPQLAGRSDIAVVSNPPYVPIAQHTQGTQFLPVNGGEDGTRFLIPILQTSYAPGTLVGILTSSLSNPKRLIEILENGFEVLEMVAFQIKFGKYTSTPEVLTHLTQLREAGRSLFSDEPQGGHSYLLMGLVLRKK